MEKKYLVFSLLIIFLSGFILADVSPTSTETEIASTNYKTTPVCSYVDEDCGMDSCLNDSSNYWDQETNKCYSGFSDELILQFCSDPDGGIKKFQGAHTFGFRSVFADSIDQRIRTGGKDSCISNNQLIEHYCDEDGFIQTLYLECSNGCEDDACIGGEEIKEEITCVFEGSKSENKCYIAGGFSDEDKGTKWCTGIDSCVIDFTEQSGEKITWKSSCGGYQYTTQDGDNEKITFNCAKGDMPTESSETLLFKNAYWQCYNGEESFEGGESSCKPYNLWKKYAQSFCENKCSSETKKCGVNSFSLSNPCYAEGEKAIVSSTAGASNKDCAEYLKECKLGDKVLCDKWNSNCKELQECKQDSDCPTLQCIQAPCSQYQCKNNLCVIDKENNETLIEVICKDSCPFDGKCYPFGYRKNNNFCSDNSIFTEQLDSENSCENNFECSSNVCVSGKCISEGLINKVINWFKKLFG